MKAPKCPKCGKEHYSTQRCNAILGMGEKQGQQKTTPPAPLSSAVDDEAPPGGYESSLPCVGGATGSFRATGATLDVHRESSSDDQDAPVSGEGRYEEFSVPVVKSAPSSTTPQQEISRATSQSAPLTPAEKQKAYRERHKDRVREADRLRKRKA